MPHAPIPEVPSRRTRFDVRTGALVCCAGEPMVFHGSLSPPPEIELAYECAYCFTRRTLVIREGWAAPGRDIDATE